MENFMAEEKQENYLEQALEANKSLKEELNAAREEMQKMADDNKTIMKQLLEGGTVQQEPEDTRSIVDVIKNMRRDGISECEWAKEALAYRKKCIDQGYGDPFVGRGDKYQPDEREQEKADNLANGLQHCIDYAEGDDRLFRSELDRITADIAGGRFINNRR